MNAQEWQPGEAEDDMCPNCLTPWKCNGPHLTPVPDADTIERALLPYVCGCREAFGHLVKCHERAKNAADALRPLLASPAPVSDDAMIESLRVAMLGTTDGGFIDPDSDIPAGEMFRLAAEWVKANLLASPVPEPGRSEAEAFKPPTEDGGRWFDSDAEGTD